MWLSGLSSGQNDLAVVALAFKKMTYGKLTKANLPSEMPFGYLFASIFPQEAPSDSVALADMTI
jgi:hypothetical protein